jgi:hypothetical protein
MTKNRAESAVFFVHPTARYFIHPHRLHAHHEPSPKRQEIKALRDRERCAKIDSNFHQMKFNFSIYFSRN